MHGRLPATHDSIAILLDLEPKFIASQIRRHLLIEFLRRATVLPNLNFKFLNLLPELCGFIPRSSRFIFCICHCL
ncbi:hypothetical protein D3C85_1836590 [compost metagenome]